MVQWALFACGGIVTHVKKLDFGVESGAGDGENTRVKGPSVVGERGFIKFAEANEEGSREKQGQVTCIERTKNKLNELCNQAAGWELTLNFGGRTEPAKFEVEATHKTKFPRASPASYHIQSIWNN